MNEYELVLGMEIHMQLDTEKKMFCSCKNDPFNSEPNANANASFVPPLGEK